MKWGIIGTGKIAGKFAQALSMLPEAGLVAVGSRSRDKAEAFGRPFGVGKCYGDYAAVAADPEVEAVYIGTPHVLHAGNARMCIEAGKAVLCEKPFAVNARQAEEIVALARARGTFVMEAMWMRFIPLIGHVRELLRQGIIGEVRMLSADFGFQADFGPEHRVRSLALGGGALLDVGIYPVNLASMIFGPPQDVATLAHLGPTGADEQAAAIFRYRGGEMAVLYAAINVDTPVEAVIMGTEGSIKIHRRFHHPTRLTVVRQGVGEEVVEMPYEGNGLQFEAQEVMQCLREGRLESAVMPLDETVEILRTMDRIRSVWGLAYPGEEIIPA